MTLAIVAGFLLMAVLILAADRLARSRTEIVRPLLMRIVIILVLVGGLFLWARYWIMYAVNCRLDCTGANLVGWDFEDAILRNSSFVEANLRGSTLNDADLYNADFTGANLAGVNFQNANLRSTRLIGALLDNADFRGAEFGDTDLRGAELNEADLTRIDLTRTHLQGVTFDNAKLVEVKLAGKNLAGLSFVGSDLTGADLSDTDLRGSRLSGANLSGARLVGSNLAGAWLNLADLTGADLRNTNLAGANLLGANLASSDLSDSQLTGGNLIGAHVNGTNLVGADLTDSRLLASELLPIDLLTDPILQELNQLQQFEIITDVDLSGVRFNRLTKWPMGRTSLLTEMLGSKFLEYTLPAPNSQQREDGKTTLSIVSSAPTLPLTEAIYRRYAQEDYDSPILLDSVLPNIAFTAFCTGDDIHVIASNQPFPQDDKLRCAAVGRELITFTVGIQALAVVVNPNNDFLNNITIDELTDLAAAKRWSDVDLSWPREEVQRYIPDIGNISLQLFWVEKLLGGDPVVARSLIGNFNLVNNGALLVQGVNSNPYAIGMFDYAIYLQNAGGLKLLFVEGVAPTVQSIQQERYRLTLPLYLYADARQVRQLTELQDFLTYYLENVNLFVGQVGLFPIFPERLEEANRQLDTLRTAEQKRENP